MHQAVAKWHAGDFNKRKTINKYLQSASTLITGKCNSQKEFQGVVDLRQVLQLRLCCTTASSAPNDLNMIPGADSVAGSTKIASCHYSFVVIK